MSESVVTFPAPIPFDEHQTPAVPQDIFSGVIGEYAAAVAESIQVPFELPLMYVLGTAAAAAQRKFRVQVHASYSEPLNIYALAILPPGERKSATKDACRFPLLEWEEQEKRRLYSNANLSWAEKAVREKKMRQLIKSAQGCRTEDAQRKLIKEVAELKEQESKIPIPPRLLADDATPEALAALLALHDQRIALLEAEGGFFDILGGRYSSGVPNLDAVLKAWGGEAIRIDRRGAEQIILNDPALALVLATQPSVLSGIAQTQAFRGRGLLGRFLFFLPKSLVGLRTVETQPIPQEIRDAYAARIHMLLQLPWSVAHKGGRQPYLLSLSHEAKALWLDFAATVERELAQGKSLSGIVDWGGKLPGGILRLAGICHVMQEDLPGNLCISEKTLQPVIKLASYLIEHAKSALGIMGTDADVECAKAILRWVTTDVLGVFSGRDCLNKLKGRWPKMSLIYPGLKLLEERYYIVPIARENPQVPGRPSSQAYKVNPIVFQKAD